MGLPAAPPSPYQVDGLCIFEGNLGIHFLASEGRERDGFIQVKALVGVQGVAMSTTAVTLFRSFVQKLIFSVSPSSFSLSQI